jgi:hypothetical protein
LKVSKGSSRARQALATPPTMQTDNAASVVRAVVKNGLMDPPILANDVAMPSPGS